jgi:hypothetical protein
VFSSFPDDVFSGSSIIQFLRVFSFLQEYYQASGPTCQRAGSFSQTSLSGRLKPGIVYLPDPASNKAFLTCCRQDWLPKNVH